MERFLSNVTQELDDIGDEVSHLKNDTERNEIRLQSLEMRLQRYEMRLQRCETRQLELGKQQLRNEKQLRYHQIVVKCLTGKMIFILLLLLRQAMISSGSLSATSGIVDFVYSLEMIQFMLASLLGWRANGWAGAMVMALLSVCASIDASILLGAILYWHYVGVVDLKFLVR